MGAEDNGCSSGIDLPTAQPEKRLLTLKLAEQLGNVTEACRRTGMDRSDFYSWKRRFQEGGLGGLKDRPRGHVSHPMTTSPEVKETVLGLALSRPDWSCARLSEELRKIGKPVSSPTIQLVLSVHGMGSEEERAWRAEEFVLAHPENLTPQLRTAIEKNNPCFGELGMRRVSAPGELLIQDTCLLTRIKDYGRVNVLITVDAYCSYGFAELATSKGSSSPEDSVLEEILPFYEEHGLPVKNIVTDEGREFYAGSNGNYGETLEGHGIEHIRLGVRSLHGNGFIARFRKTIWREFVGKMHSGRQDITWAKLRDTLAAWLYHYNNYRPHRGYPNMGKPPIDLITGYSFTDFE